MDEWADGGVDGWKKEGDERKGERDLLFYYNADVKLALDCLVICFTSSQHCTVGEVIRHNIHMLQVSFE